MHDIDNYRCNSIDYTYANINKNYVQAVCILGESTFEAVENTHKSVVIGKVEDEQTLEEDDMEEPLMQCQVYNTIFYSARTRRSS